MNETQSTQPATKSCKRDYWHIYSLSIGILVLPSLVYAVRKYGIWPDTALGFVAVGLPFLLNGCRAWNRLSHPDRIPVRWLCGYRRGEQLQALDQILTLIVIAGILISWIIDNSKRDLAHILFGFILFSSVGWGTLLRKYIEDRKYIPPPHEPYDPAKGGWSGTIKGLHSEHWGGRQIPKSEDSEA
jgi:hypothetical protein